MKFYETHFDDYLKTNQLKSLHKIENNTFDSLENHIIYGASGIGKYTKALSIIKNYSPSLLKYEKKLTFIYNKNTYCFKISDIHYEIDMSLLGCNSKLLWHELYNQIVDIISAKNDKRGIILCKNFHDIDNELLEIFFSYMQSQYNKLIDIKFYIITESITFIPENILNYCYHIKLSRPSKNKYNTSLDIKLKPTHLANNITNIKLLKNNKIINQDKNKSTNINIIENHKIQCDDIIEKIINYEAIEYIKLRESLYDLCIFDQNIMTCIWYILGELIKKNLLDSKKLDSILIETYSFIKLYNNNYRPIYHLEKYILSIVSIIHKLEENKTII